MRQRTLDRLRRLFKEHPSLRRFAYWAERVWGGGRIREALLLKLMGQHYDSRLRRVLLSGSHFMDHRAGTFSFAFGREHWGPYPFYRAFFASEVIREGDVLLDIGCGDGFFTSRFYAKKCRHVDGIDIEPDAIRAARADNAAPNIAYHLRDAVTDPFPGRSYDVAVWDGAIGHFAPQTTDRMLAKIAESLSPGGIFVGSESLGTEGHDHLQFFHSLEDLGSMLRKWFRHVELRSCEFETGKYLTVRRREGYWRCANDPARMELARWRPFGSEDGARTSP